MRVLLAIAILFLLTACMSPATRDCYNHCLEHAKQNGLEGSQMYKDACSQTCKEIHYSAGEDKLRVLNLETQNNSSAPTTDSLLANCQEKLTQCKTALNESSQDILKYDTLYEQKVVELNQCYAQLNG